MIFLFQKICDLFIKSGIIYLYQRFFFSIMTQHSHRLVGFFHWRTSTDFEVLPQVPAAYLPPAPGIFLSLPFENSSPDRQVDPDRKFDPAQSLPHTVFHDIQKLRSVLLPTDILFRSVSPKMSVHLKADLTSPFPYGCWHHLPGLPA